MRALQATSDSGAAALWPCDATLTRPRTARARSETERELRLVRAMRTVAISITRSTGMASAPALFVPKYQQYFETLWGIEC